MTSYADQIYGMLSGVGDAFAQNREDKTKVEIANRDYSRALGLDEVAKARDERNFAYQARQDAIQNDLARQRLAKGGDGTGSFFGTPIPYRKPDGSVGYALPSKAGGIKELEVPGGQFLGPYDKSLDTSRGKIDAQKPEKAAKAYNLLQSADQQWSQVQDQIKEALGQIDNAWVPRTGFIGSALSNVAGTPQYDFGQTLDMIKANIGFDKLQEMRSNSPTGGALGQVSDFENKLLQAVHGSLQPGQSEDQLKKHLNTIGSLIDGLRKDRKAAYDRDYGDISESGDEPPGNVEAIQGDVDPQQAISEARAAIAAGADPAAVRKRLLDLGVSLGGK